MIPNYKGAKHVVGGIEYTLVRPSAPIEGIEGREDLAIWQRPDGECYMLSLEQDEMIHLPDCGEQ